MRKERVPYNLPAVLILGAVFIFVCTLTGQASAENETVSVLLADEIPPSEALPCFPGAYYRKAVSSVDEWTGIEGIITLPKISFDARRVKPGGGRYLDNPSIYMGGRSGRQEIDCGLTWEVIREPDGSVSVKGKAFRPFWRNNKWYNAPARPEYYYYPGDTIRMSCRVVGPEKLFMTVELLARANPDKKFDIKEYEQKGSKPLSVFQTEFKALNFGKDKKQQYKRVNAIDQSGNEGKSVQPTQTRVSNAVWHGVWLWRGDYKLPMVPERFTDMRCPDERHFLITGQRNSGPGGEIISINGKAGP